MLSLQLIVNLVILTTVDNFMIFNLDNFLLQGKH